MVAGEGAFEWRIEDHPRVEWVAATMIVGAAHEHVVDAPRVLVVLLREGVPRPARVEKFKQQLHIRTTMGRVSALDGASLS